jgi:ribulose-5-phosphate 4-epimerase/fuculose-1-phosphate aldolase
MRQHMVRENVVALHDHASERQIRTDLAALYRIVDHLGWTELIFNHITAKVPGPEAHFLINPFGLHYSEVTASNLVKIDLGGNVIGETEWGVNVAGYIIHSAIHAARPDVKCIMHTHTTTGQAISCLEQGLGLVGFNSAMLVDRVAYHDFEGITVTDDEKPRLVESLGDRDFLILRNHGLLTCGATVAQAFNRMHLLQRACDVQVMAMSLGQPLRAIPEDAAARSSAFVHQADADTTGSDRVFRAMQRIVDRTDPGYRD